MSSDPFIACVTRFLDHQASLFQSDTYKNQAEQAVHAFREGLSSREDIENRVEVFSNLIQSTDRLSVLSGPPGSSKTYVAAAVMNFFANIEGENLSVYGVALSPQAAKRLEEKSGVPCVSFKSFVENADKFPPQTAIVLDEAGLIGTQDMLDVFEKAKAGGWQKLLLLGDYRQETPKEGGQPLLTLEQAFPSVFQRLTTGYRQKSEIQRDFVSNLYQADAKKALSVLDDGQNLLWMDGREDTLDEAVMAYLKWRSEGDNYTKTALILTQTPEDAKQANEWVQYRIRSFSSTMIWPLLSQTHAMTIRDAQGLAMDQSFVAVTEKITGQTMVSACSRHRYGIKLIVDKSVYNNVDSLSHDANDFILKEVHKTKLTNG